MPSPRDTGPGGLPAALAPTSTPGPGSEPRPGGRQAGNDLLGRTVANYVVTELLGSGGMGHVYLARHERIGQEVALKVLHADLARDPRLVRRFEDEAKAAARAGHRNIVQVFDFGELPDGRAYFVMERLRGKSLTAMLAGRRQIPVADALAIAREIALALGAAHKAGVVHRDLKPDNVFVLDDDSGSLALKVLDFGIAKLQRDPRGGGVTEVGTVFGTPQYMSPEQARGDGDVDGRADLYALGIILYEMLSGTVPFGGLPGEILARHVLEEPIDLATLRPELDRLACDLVMRCLRKNREQRFHSARDLVAAIHALAAFPLRPGTHPSLDSTPSGELPLTPVDPTDPSLPGLHATPGGFAGGRTPPATQTASDGELLSTLPPGVRRGRWIGAVAGGLLALGVGVGAWWFLGADTDGDTDDRARPRPGRAGGDGDPRASGDPRTGTGTGTAEPASARPTAAPARLGPVRIVVKTVPPGATLSVEGEPAPRGSTPIVLPVLPDERLDVHVRLDGYESAHVVVDATGPPERVLELVAKRGASKPGAGKKPKTADADGTLKPSF